MILCWNNLWMLHHGAGSWDVCPSSMACQLEIGRLGWMKEASQLVLAIICYILFVFEKFSSFFQLALWICVLYWSSTKFVKSFGGLVVYKSLGQYLGMRTGNSPIFPAYIKALLGIPYCPTAKKCAQKWRRLGSSWDWQAKTKMNWDLWASPFRWWNRYVFHLYLLATATWIKKPRRNMMWKEGTDFQW